MNHGWKRLFVVPAILWAIFCGNFTYEMIQNEKRSLYHKYIGRYDSAYRRNAQHLPLEAKTKAQRIRGQQHYSKALRELYWVLGPFFWISITLSGYIVAAGIFLPVRWRQRK